MSEPNKWKDLREALGRLSPEGEHGFEGLLARLFELETGTRFFVARKGDQPVGDAYSPAAAVALQAKRYTTSTIRENEVEGEIDRALREAPGLEVFVIAATRNLSQLATRLCHKTRETVLDILCLSFGDDLTELGALCVAHPEVIQKFLPVLGADWQRWAAELRQSPEVQAALSRLRGDLLGFATRKLVSEKTRVHCAERFRGDGAGLQTHNRILLSESVTRPAIEKQLRNWWDDKKAGIAVLEGDEGTGKTWVAGSFADGLNRSETSVVFWLDSLFWAQSGTVEDLLHLALKSIFIADEERRERIRRKIFHQWQEPVLLIMDGANERDAWKSAECILQDYFAHESELCPRIRLLFTSRPLTRRSGPGFWTGCVVIRVASFDEGEFRAALKKAAPDVSPDGLTRAVKDLAIVPRYFSLAVRLRGPLVSLKHLSKELLLWADLREKLTTRHPQVVALEHALQGSPEEVLAMLAKSVGWPTGEKPSVLTKELQKVFPDFLKARADLMDQRIILKSDFDSATLSPEHVILGWALLLRSVSERHNAEGPEQLRERLLRELEPAASDDNKVRALHLAALLSFLDQKGESDPARQARATLLGMWVSHHNAWFDPQALQVFLRGDLLGYTLAVELLFRDLLPGALETTLIAPLALRWRDGGECGELRQALERWLRLIYPGDANGSKNRDEPPPGRFVPAVTPEQLRLSYAAISVVSLRPDPSLLPSLLDCHRTPHFCYADRPGGGTVHRLPIKDTSEPLGVLLRWGYTECIIPELSKIGSRLPLNEKEDLRWFVRLLRMSQLPDEIGKAEDIYLGGATTSVQQVEEFKQLLRGTLNRERRVLGFGGIDRLAVRHDLPQLDEPEASALCAEVRHRLKDNIAAAVFPGTRDNRELQDLMPWLARYAPEEFEATYLFLLKHVVSGKDPVPGLIAIHEFFVAAESGSEFVRSILEHGQSLIGQPNFLSVSGPLTEAIVLHGDLDQLIRWLHLVEDRAFERGGSPVVSVLPLPDVFRAAAPDGLAQHAKQQFDRALLIWQGNPSDEKSKQIASHWLQVYAYVAISTKEVGEWALLTADQIGSDRNLSFSLFCLACECSDFSVFLRSVSHPPFREFQVGYPAKHWGCRPPSDSQNRLSFEQLMRAASFTVSGWLLSGRESADGLRSWGRTVANSALCGLELDGEDWFPTNLELQVDEETGFSKWTLRSLLDGRETWHDISSPVWGIDRHMQRPSLSQADYDKQLNQLREDLKKWWESTRREFIGFNAAEPLLHYSQLEPGLFVEFARKFLLSLDDKNVGTQLDFSFFASCVAVALLRINPDVFCQICEDGRGGFVEGVTCSGMGLSWVKKELWAHELNGSSEVLRLRRKLLNEATDDETLLWHVVAAHAGANHTVVMRFADEFLCALTARDRALALSLLAFQGDPDAAAKLQQAKESDPSFWAREHAIWCLEVCATEQACKQRYREVLSSGSLSHLGAGLAELRPALTPTARVWHRLIEEETGWPKRDHGMRAYLNAFWYHWDNVRSHSEDVSVYGRKLRQYCRGERLKNGLTDRQAPWWRPDAGSSPGC